MSRPKPSIAGRGNGVRHQHCSPSSESDSDSANETVLLLLGTKCARSIRDILMDANARGKIDHRELI